VFEANDRCDQENLLAQLHDGVRALQAPVNTLESNWAWMVMTSLAWTLKAWWALMLPETPGRWREQHQEEKRRVLRMEFKTFVNAFVLIPCQRSFGRAEIRVPNSWMEPEPDDILPAADTLAGITESATKSGSGCPDPPQRQTRTSRAEECESV